MENFYASVQFELIGFNFRIKKTLVEFWNDLKSKVKLFVDYTSFYFNKSVILWRLPLYRAVVSLKNEYTGKLTNEANNGNLTNKANNGKLTNEANNGKLTNEANNGK